VNWEGAALIFHFSYILISKEGLLLLLKHGSSSLNSRGNNFPAVIGKSLLKGGHVDML